MSSLVDRYKELEIKRSDLNQKATELDGRKNALDEQKTQLLATLKKEYNISSAEELDQQITALEQDLTNRVTLMETNLQSLE